MRFLVCIIIVLSVTKGLSQVDTLSKYNANGKKNGYWKVYLDDSLITTDSAHAKYYCIDYYDNGKLIIDGIDSRRTPKNIRLASSNLNVSKWPIALNGECEYYVKQRGVKTKVVSTFKNGVVLNMKVYQKYPRKDTDYCMYEFCDYTRHFENQRGSYYYEYRDCKWKNGWSYWYRKDKAKWDLHLLEKLSY